MNLKKLKGLRVEKGLSQEDIAKKLNLSTQGYRLKERGKHQFTVQEIIELSIILEQKPIDHIFFK